MTIFEFASAAIIATACAAAAIGCFALNRRIQRLASAERGIGKAVSDMSAAVTQFETLLATAERSAREASAILEEQLVEARQVVGQLEPASAAPRGAGRDTSGKVLSGDPLSDVVPKETSPAAISGRREAREPATSVAGERLAELVRRRSTPDHGTSRLRRAQA